MTRHRCPPAKLGGTRGDFGDVLFVAGAAGYYGAPAFSALSFLKAGGGYSRLAAPASVIPSIAARAGEIVFVPQRETASGSIALRNKCALLELAGRVDMVVLGPGLSLAEETQKLVRELAAKIEKPIVIDGDGSRPLQRTPVSQATPLRDGLSRHTQARCPGLPGKAAMKSKATPSASSGKRQLVSIPSSCSRGPSLIGFPDGRVYINMSGNSGMVATAGSGDVLTGAIGAMFGLGLPVQEAVRAGVFVHGFAGDLAAAAKEDGITARDIMESLPRAVAMVRAGDLGEIAERKGLYII